MKINRYKKAWRKMSFYEKNYAFHAPYNVLIDGTFCYTALKHKVKISEQLPKYLGAEVKILTTQCCIIEMENLTKLKKDLQGATHILKQFKIHRCGHEGKPIVAPACIKTMLGDDNPHRYIVASADESIRKDIREKWLGVPIMYMHHAAPTLEKPTEATVETKKEEAAATLKELEESETERLNELKAATGITVHKTNKVVKKRHRLTGAEIKRRKKAKMLRLAEENRQYEISRQNESKKRKKNYQRVDEIVSKRKCSKDINKEISTVVGKK